MTGIAQNLQKSVLFILIPQRNKRLDDQELYKKQNEDKSYMKMKRILVENIKSNQLQEK